MSINVLQRSGRLVAGCSAILRAYNATGLLWTCWASLVGAMICNNDADRVTLYAKATAELLERGQTPEAASRQLQQLWDLLEALL